MEKFRLFIQSLSLKKGILWGLFALLVIFVLIPLVVVLFKFSAGMFYNVSSKIAPSYDAGVSSNYSKGGYAEGVGMMDEAMPELSARNVSSYTQPSSGSTVGNDAEEYETTDYIVQFQTASLNRVCDSIQALKGHTYVIFENVSQNDRSCDFTFKVEKSHEQEIKDVILTLNPKILTENTRTIKQVLDDFSSTEQILKSKLAAIEDTLEEAQNSYDQLRVIATNARDAESLAKVIESKIRIIERLTTERLNLRTQLDRIGEAKSQQIDRLDYVYFTVSVYERLIVDFKSLGDTWIRAMQSFVSEFNSVIQGITIGLLKFLLYVAWAVLYLLIIVLVGKYVWRLVKRAWQS